MKKITLLLLLSIMGGIKSYAQSEWKYWFSSDGLDIYSRWSCDNCYDRHLSLKITNNNPYRIDWHYDRFEWYDNYGNVVKTESRGSWSINANSTQSSGASGLWFYPPENTKGFNLGYRFKNFRVTKD
jgi:hypothetical protein